MSFRQSLACNITPLVLRLGLAVTFLWAGYGKVIETRDYKPEELARLANLGVAKAQAAAKPSGASALPLDSGAGAYNVTASPAPRSTTHEPAPSDAGPSSPLPDPATKPAAKSGGKQHQPMRPAAAIASAGSLAQESPSSSPSTPSSPPPPTRTYTAADFPASMKLANVYLLALMLEGRSNPVTTADGKTTRPLWPAEWGKGPWPVRFAWAAGLTELIGGGLALLGFLARFVGLSLTSVMLVAIWLTSVGPNLGGGFLGFAPPFASFPEWQTFLLQIMTLCAALGLLLSGAGTLSLDRFVFSDAKPGKPADDDE